MNGCTMCQDNTKLNFLFSVRTHNYSNFSLPQLRNLIFLFPSKIHSFTQEGCWERFSPSLPVTERRVVPCSLSSLTVGQWSTPVCRNTDLKSKMRWFLHLSWPKLTVLPSSSTARKLYISTKFCTFSRIHSTLCAALAAITILLMNTSKFSTHFYGEFTLKINKNCCKARSGSRWLTSLCSPSWFQMYSAELSQRTWGSWESFIFMRVSHWVLLTKRCCCPVLLKFF